MADIQRRLQQALAAHQRRDFAEAERGYRFVLKMAPRQFDALQLLGAVLLQRGQNDEAERFLRTSLSVNPRDLGVISNLGVALQRLKRYDEALQMVDQVLAVAPTALPALSNRGNILRLLGRYDEALASLDRALALKSDFFDAICNRALVLAGKGQFVQALVMHELALQMNPTHAESLKGKGDVLLRLDRREEAITAYSAALKQGGDKVQIEYALAALGVGERPAASPTDAGVDLGPNMLDKARQRSAYDELVCGDIVEYLRTQQDGRFDVVIAADVFVYVGELAAVFHECRRVLRDGGRLVFSVEAMEGDGIELRPTLRYAHSETYLRNLASLHCFGWETGNRGTLRLDGGVPIEGQLVMLR